MERFERPFRFVSNPIDYLIPGGTLINRFLGRETRTPAQPSQLWVASTVQSALPDAADSRSFVAAEDGGECFGDLLASQPYGYLGAEHATRFGPTTGILLKLLNARDRLLVQTHPDKARAARYFGLPFGKTEAWYVLDTAADTQAVIYAGFQPGVTRESFRRLIETQDTQAILACLHAYDIHPGDVIFIPAGLPHAMGKDSLVAEIQEPIDITLRAERIRTDGSELSEQSLHSGIGIDGLLDCFDFVARTKEDTRQELFLPPQIVEKSPTATETALLSPPYTECFGMHKIDCTGCHEKVNQRFVVGLVLAGQGSLVVEETTLPLEKGTEFFIPNGVHAYRYDTSTALQVLECYPPSSE